MAVSVENLCKNDVLQKTKKLYFSEMQLLNGNNFYSYSFCQFLTKNQFAMKSKKRRITKYVENGIIRAAHSGLHEGAIEAIYCSLSSSTVALAQDKGRRPQPVFFL